VVAGYSGTPLAKKLGIKVGSRVFAHGALSNYRKLLAPLPDGVTIVARMSAETDIAHLFATRRADLAREIKLVLGKMPQDGVIWVSWPKKSSKVPTDITEDTIREVALPLGLVDIKVCAVDEMWSGLKLVIRRENRKS
jgi:hypothetical protein